MGKALTAHLGLNVLWEAIFIEYQCVPIATDTGLAPDGTLV